MSLRTKLATLFAPAPTGAPVTPQPPPTLVLGTTRDGGAEDYVTLSPAERRNHILLLGTTGTGKSMFIASLAVQLTNQGLPWALIDPHTDLAHGVIQMFADRGYFKNPRAFELLRYFDFSRTDRCVPFNVLRQPYDPHTVATQVNEAFKRTWPSLEGGAAPLLENVLLHSVITLVYNRLPITELLPLITRKEYRDQLVSHVPDAQVRDFFRRFDSWGTGAMIESTARRLNLLTFNPVLRASLGQHDNALSLRELMDRGISLICDLGGLDEDCQKLLGCLLMVGFENAALSRADMPAQQRREYHLFCDEYSMMSATSEESLARILDLTRKYGLFVLAAFQHTGLLGRRLEGAIQNAISVAFQLGNHDAAWAAARFTDYDPYLVKHESYTASGRPSYYSLSEQRQLTAMALEGLEPREAFVRAGRRIARFHTLGVPTGHADIAPILGHYAERLLRPRPSLDPIADGPRVAEQRQRRPVRRMPLREGSDEAPTPSGGQTPSVTRRVRSRSPLQKEAQDA